MRRTLFALALVVALAARALAVRASAQGPLPKSVTVGTNPAGTVYFALASGIAKVVSGAAGYQMVVQPHAGTSTMLPPRRAGSWAAKGSGDGWLSVSAVISEDRACRPQGNALICAPPLSA